MDTQEHITKTRKQILEEARVERNLLREKRIKAEEEFKAQKAEARKLKAEQKQQQIEDRKNNPPKRGRHLLNLTDEEKIQKDRERQERQAIYYLENKEYIKARVAEYNKTYDRKYVPRTGGKRGRPKKVFD
eukprot:Lithocolla_globosa_v1_NODE_412_length_4122_cov_166.322351.p3 type:complete len:131 gc:universal NODE_412_length_4122_cov_166.322351:1493-1101(-)